ncbi:hypothetical protein PR048_002813 [Dryococelus australis]|uniref:Uncharacterized protein n=1 Tax=Dryococelus australis TaxID=614101 RepID=A0ABQ9ILA8_9NEOP|nr:hypothetical protein PR048_002813 [Dryococelus australis]
MIINVSGSGNADFGRRLVMGMKTLTMFYSIALIQKKCIAASAESPTVSWRPQRYWPTGHFPLRRAKRLKGRGKRGGGSLGWRELAACSRLRLSLITTTRHYLCSSSQNHIDGDRSQALSRSLDGTRRQDANTIRLIASSSIISTPHNCQSLRENGIVRQTDITQPSCSSWINSNEIPSGNRIVSYSSNSSDLSGIEPSHQIPIEDYGLEIKNDSCLINAAEEHSLTGRRIFEIDHLFDEIRRMS